MAEDKKITISRTLNGKIIYFIARNSTGKIIARELTQENLEKAIKTYKEPPSVEEDPSASSGQGEETEHLPGEQHRHLEGEGEPKKKFLTNELAEKVQKRKKEQETKHLPGGVAPAAHLEGGSEEEKSQKKKSFWDKLK